MEEQQDLLVEWTGWEGEGDVRLFRVVWVNPQVKFLEVRSTYLDNDEQGVFNDIGEIQLEESSILRSAHVLLRSRSDLDGLHGSEHTGYLADPLSPGRLPPNPAS